MTGTGPGASFFERRARGRLWRGLRAEFAALDPAILFPLRRWRADRPWNLVWVRCLVLVALGPLALAHALGDATLAAATWAFGALFAGGWALLLHRGLRVSWRGPVGGLRVAAFAATVAGGLVGLGQQLPVLRDLYAATSSPGLAGRAAGFVLGVGLLEETAKGLPLVWHVLARAGSLAPTEAAFLGAVSGLVFGVMEAGSYSAEYGLGQELGVIGPGRYLILQLVRLSSLPLLHALWSGLLGSFVGIASAVPARARALVLVGLALAATLHGLYELTAASWPGLAVVLVSALALVSYARSADAIVQALQPPTPQAPPG